MKSNLSIILFTLILLFKTSFFLSCKQNNRTVERTNVDFEVVTDSIYSRLPSTLLKTKDYLVWHDAFGSEGFIHIVDIQSGKEVGTMGNTGQGPEEFNTPVISSGPDNNIFVFDLNTNHQAYFSIDNLLSDKKNYIKFENNEYDGITRKIQLDKNRFVILQPEGDKRFRLLNSNITTEFGAPIIEGPDFDNKYSINQGSIEYNSKKNKLVYASYRFPYIEIYDIKNDEVSLSFSNVIPENLYQRKGSEIVFGRNRTGSMDMTLTKDYIVTVQRDYETDDIEESTVGMDFSKLPKTLFLYDYDGNLKKIVNVNIPVFGIAGDINNNEVYALGTAPEFVIAKFKL